MTALTSTYEVERQDGLIVSVPVKASAVIYKGAMLVDKGTGYAEPGCDGSGYIFLGVAVESVTGSSVDGGKEVRVEKTGVYKYHKASAVQTDLNTLMYIVDDNTVASSRTNSVACGYVVGIPDSSHVKLRIDNVAR